MADCVALWVGSSLGRIERACLRSALRTGHRVTLYTYEDVTGVPEGVVVADARQVLPEQSIIRHVSGSPSLFSNWFRYRLQELNLGTWIDCDAYFVGKLDLESPYLFGRDTSGTLCTGILRLPSDSPILTPLLEVFQQRSVPPWIRIDERLKARARLLITGRTGIEKMPWGVAGPNAFTALARQFKITDRALEPDALYPVHWSEAGWIRDPAISLEQIVAPETRSVHLYNEVIKGFKDEPAPPGSFLERLHEEGR